MTRVFAFVLVALCGAWLTPAVQAQNKPPADAPAPPADKPGPPPPEVIKAAVETFNESYKSADEEKRKAALEALEQHPCKETALAAAKGLLDPSVALRKLTAQIFTRMNVPECVPPLLAALKANERDSLTTIEIVKALGRIGDVRAVEPLLSNIWSCNDSDVFRYRVRALGGIWDKSAIDGLIKLMVAGNRKVGTMTGVQLRNEIQKTLKRLTGQNFGDKAVEWNNWWSKNERTFKLAPKPEGDPFGEEKANKKEKAPKEKKGGK